LERKLPLMIFGVLAVVLATSLGVSYYQVRRAAELLEGDRLSSLSHALSSMFEQQIVSRLGVMHRIAADSSIAAALQTPTLAPSLPALRALSPLRLLADSATPPVLMTPDGHRVGDVRLETPSDVSRLVEDIRQLGLSTDSSHVGRLYSSGGHASFWLTVPVRQNGNLIGYLMQERRMNSNPRALGPIRDVLGSNVELYLRNAGDNSVWASITGVAVPPPSMAKSFLGHLDVFTHGARGEALAATSSVLGTPLLVTLEAPMESILARPQATIRVLTVLAFLLAVVGAAIAWLLSRQLARPLVELTSAAEGIALGQYSERVAARGSDEIGRLGAVFNRMAEQVQLSSNRSHEAVDRLTRSMATQQFLAEASEILARSLSDQTLLAELARHCTPSIADYCTIHIADDDGMIRRVETAHHDPAKQEIVRSLVRRYEDRIDGTGPVPTVIRSQQPVLLPRLDKARIAREAPDETAARLLLAVGPSSFMSVPLIARGRAFGAMSFTITDSGRTFGQDDLDLAMELSRRTAVAIDNAVIYRRSIALRLEAEAASNAKSDFLAKMSHEIRTPINAMMGYAELLEMGISGPVTEGQARQLSRIRASGEHLTSLVNEMLDLAKIEAGRMTVEPMDAITGDAAEAALALIRPQAVAKGVEIAPGLEGHLRAPYIGDPQRVQQILMNLLSNAVKFTASGGSVSVRCAAQSGPGGGAPEGGMRWASITVQDTGVGIAAGDLERIFHPFVQVENGYTRVHGGTGLGLTISRSLAQMMGGDIAVESVLGEGSRFTLWLPAPKSCVIRT
jgi:signal transduction histidine kinase